MYVNSSTSPHTDKVLPGTWKYIEWVVKVNAISIGHKPGSELDFILICQSVLQSVVDLGRAVQTEFMVMCASLLHGPARDVLDEDVKLFVFNRNCNGKGPQLPS
jgi:hypothetical protein